MKPLRSYNRKARRRVNKWKYLRNKLYKATLEAHKITIDWFFTETPFYRYVKGGR